MGAPIVSIITVAIGLISLFVTILIIVRFLGLCSDISSIAESMNVISKHLQASKTETKEALNEEPNEEPDEERKEYSNIDEARRAIIDKTEKRDNLPIIIILILIAIAIFTIGIVFSI